ncbi:MAG TPA: LysM peptidoglycan-binding domain-containing protein [Anaerolineales bacterium]|nr:LysM peptidoglycan-binding domain-containing protein [Anaerolineales bacterium]
MEKRHLPSWVLVRLLAITLAATACTRPASTPPSTTDSTGATQSPLTAQQATMEAVRSALLTQTAQARIILPTARPTTEVPPSVTPTQTETMTPVAQIPTDTPVATGASGTTAAPTSAPTAVPTSSGGGSGYTEYTVQPGEWVYSIARKFGVDPQAIIDLNNLVDPFTLYPGDVIKIPTSGNAPVPPSGLGSSSGSATDYTVQLGDYVSSIAVKFGVPMDAIITANNLIYPYTLYPGQVIKIP